MFSNLRIGQPFYILHKGDSPYCEIGSVVSVSNPMPRFANNTMPFNQDMVVDVKVKVGENTFDFQKLTSSASIGDLPGITVSESKDAINSEIEAIKSQNLEELNRIDTRKQIVASCDEMLKTLNPHYAKEKLQEEEIGRLKEDLSGVKGDIGDIKDMLSSFLKQNNVKQPKNDK